MLGWASAVKEGLLGAGKHVLQQGHPEMGFLFIACVKCSAHA